MLRLFFPIMWFFSALFVRARYPLAMGLILLIQTCLVFWVDIIVLLVFMYSLSCIFSGEYWCCLST